jgi:hypothetical protein
MSDAKKPTPNAGKKAVEAQIAAHLTAFDRHRTELLDPLRELYERGPKTKPFDANNAWKSLRFSAYIYLRSQAEVSQQQAMTPAGDRHKLLCQLGNALRDARRKADEAMKTSHWFMEWAIANGNPDFTDGRIERYQEEFETRVARLKGLEEAAYQAAETVRKKRGRPPGTTALPHDFILNLEKAYRNITKKKAGAGSGPFFRFVIEFLTALGRECSDETVNEAIKAARKREEKHRATSRWGRDLFDV